MKRKIIYITIVMLLVSITLLVTISLKKDNKYQKVILLGNDYNITNADKTFTSSFMDSQYLLTILESDASKVIDDKVIKLSNLIKSSTNVIINIGKIDIEEQISIIDNKLIYDLDIINRKKEMLIHNKEHIVSIIHSINDKTIIEFVELSYPYSIHDDNIISIYKEINEKQ